MSDWIPWYGGKKPVDDGVIVDVRFCDGGTLLGQDAKDLEWRWQWDEDWEDPPKHSEIVAYRIAEKGERDV
jgi:hypothetical protein